MNTAQKLLVVLGVATASVAAHAQTAPTIDYTSITGAVALGAMVTGIVAIGVVKIVPNSVAWATQKLASMFGR